MTNKEFLRELEELTDRNLHSEARELIARQAAACGMHRANFFLANLSALISYHEHITPEAQAFRDVLTQELLDEIKFYFGEEEATKINACL